MCCQAVVLQVVFMNYSLLHIVFFVKNVLHGCYYFFSSLLKQVKSFIEQLGLQNMVLEAGDEGWVCSG